MSIVFLSNLGNPLNKYFWISKLGMKYNLSEITEVIQNRRSIKPEGFSSRKVHKELVTAILNNGLWAPTHGMTQPWRFKVFTGDALERLGNFMANTYKDATAPEDFKEKAFEKYRSRPTRSTVAVAICMDRQESGKIPEIEEVEAVACAVQNMHLTATAYGLGGYWSSGKVIYSDAMKTMLGLKAKDKCLGVFYIGYPEGEWPSGQRKPLEYVVEWIEE